MTTRTLPIIILSFFMYLFAHGQQVATDDLVQTKLNLELKIKNQTQKNVLCFDTDATCIDMYKEALEWDLSPIKKIENPNLIVSSQLATIVTLNNITLNPYSSNIDLQKKLGLQQQDASTQNSADIQAPFCSKQDQFNYEKLFQDGQLDITVVRGYFDGHDESWGGVLLQQIFKSEKVQISIQDEIDDIKNTLDHLTQKGYKISRPNSLEYRLVKNFNFNGKPRQINIKMISSTIQCPNEVLHKGGYVLRDDDEFGCEEQKLATLYAVDQWKKALNESEVLIYSGHSRLGKGPDFGPLGVRDGKVGFTLQKNADVPLALLVSESCKSASYFSSRIEELQQSTVNPFHFIGTLNATYFANFPQLIDRLATLTSEEKCLNEIKTALNSPMKIMPHVVYYHSTSAEQAKLTKRYKAESGFSFSKRSFLAPDVNGEPICVSGNSYDDAKIVEAPDKACAVGKMLGENNDGIFCRYYDKSGVFFGNELEKSQCED